MKEVDSYKEDDFRYKDFKLEENELKKLSDYFNHNFKAAETRLLCIYNFMGDFVTAQVQEDLTYDLTPGEFEKIFKKIPD